MRRRYDGTTQRLYVDGAQVGSLAAAGAIVDVDLGALRIGGNSIWGEYFAGLIDEVRIYNRALTQTEIQADMNSVDQHARHRRRRARPARSPRPAAIGQIALSWGAATDNVGVVALQRPPLDDTRASRRRAGEPDRAADRHELHRHAASPPARTTTRSPPRTPPATSAPPRNEASATATADTTPPTASTPERHAPARARSSLTWNASTDNVGVARYNVHRSTTPASRRGRQTGSRSRRRTSYADTGLAARHLLLQGHRRGREPATSRRRRHRSSVTVVNTAPPVGLVAAYGFDEAQRHDAADSSGNGNTGTVSGATWVDGRQVRHRALLRRHERLRQRRRLARRST